MNQEKIGKFIAICRKEKNLTQNQLAEKLQITNKAISKWETGRGMPDSSLLLNLCEILDITVNELLSGERLQENKYQIKAEENIIAIVKENDKSKMNIKRIIIFCVIIVFIVLTILIIKYCMLLNSSNVYNRIDNYNPICYQITERYEEINKASVEIDNLKVILKGIYFDSINEEEISNLNLTQEEKVKIIKNAKEQDLNCLLEISTLDGSNMNELIFDYMIYDNNKNILSTSLGFTNAKVPYYNQFYNNFIINSDDKIEHVDILMNKDLNKIIVKDNFNSVLFLISAKKEDDVSLENINLSNLHILIAGANYKNDENEVFDFSNKIFEFIIKK